MATVAACWNQNPAAFAAVVVPAFGAGGGIKSRTRFRCAALAAKSGQSTEPVSPHPVADLATWAGIRASGASGRR